MSSTYVIAADDGLTPHERKSRNLNAIQLIYRQGVPHTDKQGQPLYKYEDGKSFFPIGIWGSPMPGDRYGSHYDWKVLKQAGFNTVWPWGKAPAKSAIEAARDNDLQLILMSPRSETELKLMKDDPYILGNVWADEPIGRLGSTDMDKYFDEYAQYRSLAKKIAPKLNIFTNGTAWITPPATSWWIKWNTAGDVSCHDNYPIKFGKTITRSVGLDPNGIPQSVSLAVGSNNEQKPVWLIVGAFDEPGVAQAFPFRLPSVMQLRAQVYSGIIHGATGIHYFIEDSYVSRNGGVIGMSPDPKVYRTPTAKNQGGKSRITPATPMQMAQSRALWQATESINDELKILAPIILSPTVGPEVNYKVDIVGRSVTDSPIRCMLKPHPDGGYVLLSVNLDDSVLDVTYTFPKEISEVERLFENQPLQTNETPQKSFVIHYEPYEVHVLRIIP